MDDALVARLLQNVAAGPGGCWVWTGKRDGGRYGSCRWQGRQQGVHRLAWLAWVGPIPPGLFVLHSCDRPACFWPGHLFLGTQSQNMLDASQKGRHGARLGFPDRKRPEVCKNGHRYTPDTVAYRRNGWRRCLLCEAARGR